MTYDPKITFRNQRILNDFDAAPLVQQPVLAVRLEKNGRSYFVVQPTCRWLSPGSWIQRLIFITQRIFGIISTEQKKIANLRGTTLQDVETKEYQTYVGWNPTALISKEVTTLTSERDAAQNLCTSFQTRISKLTTDINALEIKNKDLNAALNTATTDLKNLNAPVEADVSRITQRLINRLSPQVQSTLKESKSVLASLDTAVAITLDDLNELSKKLADKEKDNLESLRKKKDDLTRELTELKSKYTILVEALEKYNKGLIDLKVVPPIPMDSTVVTNLVYCLEEGMKSFQSKDKYNHEFSEIFSNLKTMLVSIFGVSPSIPHPRELEGMPLVKQIPELIKGVVRYIDDIKTTLRLTDEALKTTESLLEKHLEEAGNKVEKYASSAPPTPSKGDSTDASEPTTPSSKDNTESNPASPFTPSELQTSRYFAHKTPGKPGESGRAETARKVLQLQEIFQKI